MSDRYPRDTCYICKGGTASSLEKHHIVPQRYEGGERENIVHLCPRCHKAVEKLYDKRFYNAIGAERIGDVGAIVQAASAAGRFIGLRNGWGSARTVDADDTAIQIMDAVLTEFGVAAVVCVRCGSLGSLHETRGKRAGCDVCSYLQEPEQWQMLGVSGGE